MKKSDLVTRVAIEAPLSKSAAGAALYAVLTATADALANGEIVTLAGFGTFSTKTHPARQGAIHSRREHRHRDLNEAFVQGGKSASRRSQPTVQEEARSVSWLDDGSPPCPHGRRYRWIVQ